MKPAKQRPKPAKTQPARRNPKRTGELSEAAFMLKARTLGFNPAKPWGDSERYDFILDTGPRLWRVQLKCTEVLRARGYDVQPIYSVYGKGKITYTADDIDVLIAHIIPLDTWYIIPIAAIAQLHQPPPLSRHPLQMRPLGNLPRSLAPPPIAGVGRTFLSAAFDFGTKH